MIPSSRVTRSKGFFLMMPGHIIVDQANELSRVLILSCKWTLCEHNPCRYNSVIALLAPGAVSSKSIRFSSEQAHQHFVRHVVNVNWEDAESRSTLQFDSVGLRKLAKALFEFSWWRNLAYGMFGLLGVIRGCKYLRSEHNLRKQALVPKDEIRVSSDLWGGTTESFGTSRTSSGLGCSFGAMTTAARFVC